MIPPLGTREVFSKDDRCLHTCSTCKHVHLEAREEIAGVGEAKT